MISLGTYDGYVLLVNRSNVEPSMVTYHLYKDGTEVGMAREDTVGCRFDDDVERVLEDPNVYLYFEAMKRYEVLNRPPLDEWSPEQEKALLEAE